MDGLFGHFQEGLRQHPFAFVGKTLVVALGLALTYLVCLSVYNVFFHPLRDFPGPKLWAMSRIPYTRNSISGRPQKKMLDLHQTYGPFVRVAPEIIAISHPNAAKDLRGHRKGGEAEHGKDPINMYQFRSSILGANREDHTRFRRVMSHGFSAQAMMEQQSTIKSYVDLLFKRLHEKCTKGTQPLDMVRWYNWTTFDIIGDLAFGEPFHCLENASYHPWVSLIFESIKNLALWSNASRYQSIAPLLRRFLIPRSLATKMQEHNQLAEMKVRKRLATETNRPDFIGKMVQGSKNKGGDLTFAELSANASILIIAGSETTATLLSGATFLLAKNLRTLATLTEEVRSTFTSEDEIDLVSTQHLTYLQAVLDESLRFYPPAPSGQPRKIAAGGDEIAGRFVPEGTIVETWQWPLYHNPAYFTLPDEFIPERWLGDKRFVNDQRDAVQPFSVGPRNCIGRNLAYAEMRIILARMIWNFDLKLADQSKDWYEQNSLFILWEKGPLYVYLTPRHNM